MTNVFIIIFRVLFALILTIAAVITIIILAPFWLVMRVWNLLSQKKKRR